LTGFECVSEMIQHIGDIGFGPDTNTTAGGRRLT